MANLLFLHLSIKGYTIKAYTGPDCLINGGAASYGAIFALGSEPDAVPNE
jgi:hypothetical protein